MSPSQFAARVTPDRGASDPAPAEREEGGRLAALDALDILDTPPEEEFDRVVRLAKRLFDVPIALVSFIDGHRQWHKAIEGLTATEIPRADSFCRFVVDSDRSLVVRDALADPRFAGNPYVAGEPHVRFYAGLPLRSRTGHAVGTFCIIDTKPRAFREDDLALLSDLAGMVADELVLREAAATDSLTGTLTRRYFHDEAVRAVSLATRHHDDCSIVLIDLDYFKSVNEAHGHAAGDLVLRAAVEAIRGELRTTDLAGRIGGAKFGVLLPQTGEAGARATAERIRHAIARLNVDVGRAKVQVTASLGVASLDPGARDAETLLAHADTALLRAKEAGRNRTVGWHDGEVDQRLAGHRVLKRGQIVFNGRMSSVDCTVRRLSDEAASLDVSSTAGLPTRFDLVIKSDRFEKPCRVTTISERRVEVAFC